MTEVPTKRRICWPNPDATCLEGGCSYCNFSRLRSIKDIAKYAKDAGVVRNRGIGEQDAMTAFQTGLENGWFGRVETR